MATYDELMAALRNAHAAGDTAGARELARRAELARHALAAPPAASAPQDAPSPGLPLAETMVPALDQIAATMVPQPPTLPGMEASPRPQPNPRITAPAPVQAAPPPAPPSVAPAVAPPSPGPAFESVGRSNPGSLMDMATIAAAMSGQPVPAPSAPRAPMSRIGAIPGQPVKGAAGGPAPQPAAAIDPATGQPYTPMLEALAAEIGNVPERLMRAGHGMALQQAELGIPAALGQIAILKDAGAGPEYIDRARGALTDVQRQRRDAQAAIDQLSADMTQVNPAPGLDQAVVSGVSSFFDMAPGLAATLIARSPLPMMAYLTAYSKGGTYADKRAAGVAPAKANTAADLFALAEAIPEMLPLGVLLDRGIGAVAKVAGSAVTEAVSEAVTSGLQSLIDIGVLDARTTWGEAMSQAGQAAAAGGVMGLLSGSGAVVADKVAGGAKAKEGTPADPNAAPPAPSPTDQIAAAMTAPPEAPAQPAADAAPVAPAPAKPAPQRMQPTPIARADAEADPGRYEIIGQSEGTGADWRDTGTEAVLDKTTGQVHPLASDQAAPPEAAAPEPAAPPAAQPVTVPQPTTAAKPANQPSNFEFLNAQDVQGIGTEPGVMQYKAGGDAEGVTDRLKGVTEWRPERAGVSVVYEYADGRRVIADGHQRLGLAKRLAAQGKPIQMPVIVLRQADGVTPEDARVTAALKNIAEGSGTALDAAKVLRGSRQTVQDMALPPGSAIVRDAMGMRDLSDAAFGMVVNGVASERDGGIVGRVVTDQAAQANILGLLSRMQKDRPITAFQAEQVARQAAADTVTETQDSLFGPESDTKNLYLERAKIIEAATRMKREELRAFKNVVENADRLEAAGNQLDTDANQSAVDSAARLRDYLSREANTKGPISDALTEAARALNGGASVADATRQFLAAAERVAAGGLVQGQPAQGSSSRPGGDQGSGTPDAQRDPEPEAPVDAGADLFAPPQTGKSPAQVKAEAEAEVRAQQSMIRKPGGNSGDAGPLFDTQGDLLAQKPKEAEADPRAALLAARDKALAPYTQPDDAKFDAARGSVSLFGTDAGNELLDAMAAAETLDAKRKAAEAWVLKQGRATGLEHLVVLDKDGTPLSVDMGSKNGVSPTSAVWAAGAHGKVALSIHNHPASSGLSGGDLAMAAIWPHTMIVLGHNGDRHQITGTPAFDRSSGYRQATAQNRSADYFGKLKDALTGLRLVSDDRLSSARDWTTDDLDAFQVAARPLIQLVLDDMGLIAYDRKAEWRAQFDATGLDYRGIYEPVSSSGNNRLGRAGWVIPARGDQSDNRPDGGRAEAASPGPDGGNQPSSQTAGAGGKQGDKPAVSPPKTKMDADFDAAMDALFGKDNGDVSSPGNDLERGGGDGTAADGVGGSDVPAPAGRDGRRGERGTRKSDGGNRKRRSGGGVSGDNAAVLGTGGNPAADGSGGANRQPAPGGDSGGRDGNRAGGLSPDAGGNQAPAGNASGQPRPRLTPAERAAILKNALKEDIAEWAASRADRSTGSPAFKRWFGDSKVVDAEGRPLVVYHGTAAFNGEAFDTSETGRRDYGWWGKGFYFTAEPTAADAYSSNEDGDMGQVLPVLVRLANPKIVSSSDRIATNETESLARRAEWEAQGHDGVIVRNEFGDTWEEKNFWEVVAFSPTQIKSIFNRGTWDGSDPRMLAEDTIDPVRYDQMVEAFVDGLEGVNVAQATDSQLFMAMAKPLMDFMTREELTAIRPYFYHFLLELRAGRVNLTPDVGPQSALDRLNAVLPGWSGVNSMLTNPDPERGGIIDRRIADKKYFVILNGSTRSADGFDTIDQAADWFIQNYDKATAPKPEPRVVFNDRANIDKTLPLLLPEQRDDVAKIEARFAKPDGHGMLITNGTGTGKTYTGMGAIKRFVQAGKKNILIVAPSEAVIDGWKKASEALGVPVYQLLDTKDAGQDVTITTYANMAANQALASRAFDLIVTDESQNLMSSADGSTTGNITALRALSMHPRGLGNRWDMQHAEDWAKAKAMPKGDRKDAAMARLFDQRRAAVEKWATQPRSKVLFLSATPWAYDKTVDYTEGYLFNYPEDQRIGNSNQTGRAAFFVQNFGYRIRYHKLTRPEHAVDSAVFERDFHEKLKREGVLSGRSLQIDVDYDRRFVRKDDVDGNRLDDALEALDNLARAERDEAAAKQKTAKPGERVPTPFGALQDHMRKNFDYLERQKLLEAIKARMAIPEIEKHLALGRKVVVFHDFNVGGGFNPFTHLKTRNVVIDPETGESADVPVSPMSAEAAEGYRKLVEQHPWIAKLNFDGYKAPIKALPDALGKRARLFNGTIPTKQRLQNLADFNTDGSGADVLVVQADAGGAGISMHDTTGKHQRVLINLGMPTKPTTTLQQEGRILRVGTKTNAPFRYFTIGTGWEREAFAKRIAERSGTVENLALGNEARDLMNAFIDAYMDAADFEPSAQDGIGGKAKDSRAVTITPYERAKSHYFGRPKTTGRRDQREGVDFYATPEPLGLKMVEWAGIRANERVLEPSAGDGAIARYMPDDAAITLVEPSTSLGTTALLRAPKATLVGSTFENYYVGNKQHVIVMNPPFGAGGATAVAHLAKAARHLRPGGRIVALIPTGPAADKRFEAWYEGEDAKGLTIMAEVNLPAVAFERAGTGVMTRVVVIDKMADPKATRSYVGMRGVDLTGARTVAEFFDRLENIALPERPAPTEDILDQLEAESEDAATPPRVTRPGPALVGEVGAFERTTWRSNKGKDFPAAFHKARVERELYDQLKQVAERFGGWFGRGGARTDGPTFAFRTEADRERFIEATGRPTVGMEETAYHGGPHDFDQFGLEHIGTGEGAQAYGWGLYFASRRGVAEWYRDKLSRRMGRAFFVDGKQVGAGWIGHMALSTAHQNVPFKTTNFFSGLETYHWYSERFRQDVVSALMEMEDDITKGQTPVEAFDLVSDFWLKKEPPYPDEAESVERLREGFREYLRGVTTAKPGRLYTVDIPGPDNLLDWDAPLSEQPEKVKAALASLGIEDKAPKLEWRSEGDRHRLYVVDGTGQDRGTGEYLQKSKSGGWDIYRSGKYGGALMRDELDTESAKSVMAEAEQRALQSIKSLPANGRGRGVDAYYALSRRTGYDRGASMTLRAAGIPGHRYLDGGSRGNGDGSHNYVIYDDAAITIIQKEQRAQMVRAAVASTEEIRRLMPALRAELDRLDLKRVRLTQFEGKTNGWQGMFQVTGDGEMEIIIGASLDPMKTLHHEVIHAMRAMNLFTPEEWKALKLAAHRSWYQKHNIKARYSSEKGGDVPLYLMLTAEQELEEAIAEEFSEALSKREAPKGGLLITAFNKIARLLRAFRNVLNGAGFQTTEDIFGRILAGEIGKRNAGNTGAVRRFQRNPSAAMGDLFAPPAEPAKSGMTDAQRREMEARAMQSKMRKTGGNSGDAGPLFSDDRDLFGDRLGFNENPPFNAEAFASSLKDELGLRDLSLFMTKQGDLKVNMIAVDRAKQGQGIGTAAMTKIAEYADRIGARIILSPGQRDDGFGTTSRDRLVRFYRRFGFIENKGRNKDFAISEGMYREPRPAMGFNENPPLAVRPLTPYGRAVRNNAMGATPFVPDRRVWETLTRAGAPIWQRLRDLPGAASDAVDRARYVIQDRFLPVLRAQEAVMFQTGQPLPAGQDAYTAETTFSGKVGRHLLDIDERFTKPIIGIMAGSRGRMTAESVGDWLYARHAQERNAYIASINPQMPDGGSGMTDAEAQTILSVVAASPDAAAYDQIGQLIDGLRDWSITLRKDAGLISDTQETTWRNQYAHYVPLKGWEETDHQESVLSMMPPRLGRRFSIRGQETQRALGRTSEAFNPLQASITMAQEVAIRAEKNRVAQTLYNLAAAHPSEALWKVKTPKQKQYFNRTTGLVETRIEQPVTMGMDPNEMAVKIGGKEHRILFMDERIARAAGTLGPDQMGAVMRVLSIFSRFFSMTRTMLNPEFMITNAFRDFQTAQFNVQGLSELDRGKIAKAMARDWRKAFLGIMRGQTYRFDTEWSRYFDEFQKAGAQVWFWTMENPTAAREHLARRIDLARGTRARRMLRAMTSPAALLSFRDNPALAYIERVNMAVDNAIRLAAFVEARKQGMPVEKAAFLAKELTVNFNRRGEAGPQMNALYPFFNAAIQGTIRTGKALSSRRVAGMVLTAFAGGLLLDLINAALSDRDEDDELFYDKVPNYRNERNLHFVLWGKGDDPLAIPMPYGYNVFPYAGQQLGKVIRGVKDADKALADVAAAVFGAYSPISAATPAQMISPFIADPIVEMAENKDGLGRPIFPETYGSANEPDAYTHFKGATEASKWVAQTLNAITGGDFREPGLIDVSPEALDHLSNFVVGSAGAFWGRSADMIAKTFSGNFDQIEGRNVPFLRNLTSPIGEWADRDRYYRFGAEVKNAAADKKAYEGAGVAVPKRTAALAGLYDAWLAAERERNGKGEWNPSKANSIAARAQGKVFLDFNRKYIAVMGHQGE